jgi:hypothetical protein
VTLARRGLSYPATRRALIGDESERHFQDRVKRLAHLCGWVAWHTRDSMGTRAGEPDLRMCRPPRYLLAELKSQHGRLRLEQVQTIALLQRCPGIETYLWRPSDWEEIVSVLH